MRSTIIWKEVNIWQNLKESQYLVNMRIYGLNCCNTLIIIVDKEVNCDWISLEPSIFNILWFGWKNGSSLNGLEIDYEIDNY